jgi:putative transposase
MVCMRQFHRRHIRLPLERYADMGTVWHVTLTAHRRRSVLANAAFAAELVSSLETACHNAGAQLLMYCLMPDHVHALIQIEETDLISIIRNFKSFSTKIWWKHGEAGKLWQRSAYDRGVRVPESMNELLGYIFENPAGIGDIEAWIERGLLGGKLFEDAV